MIPHRWKRAAADNGLSDPNADLRPGRFANTVLGSIRGLMATGAAARDDAIGGLVATLGTSNIYSVGTNEGLVDLATGIGGIPAAITSPFLLRLSFDTTLAGSVANVPHLKVDGVDCGPILNSGGGALADGDLFKGRPLLVLGDMAAGTDTQVTRVRVLDLLPSDIAALAPGGYPIGGLMPFTGSDIPTGFLIANGATLLRASYPKLWAHAQASGMITSEASWTGSFANQSLFTTGDGSTNFRIPYLCGLFVRALDYGRGLDANRALGTSQSDAFRSHNHALTGGGYVYQLYGTGPEITIAQDNKQVDIGTHAVNIANAGDVETRPYNAAFPQLIRAY
jgi:hypothetical protein